MATPTSPSMPPSRKMNSDASEPRGRMVGNSFAQLVSRFEILDAMSSASNRLDPQVSPRAMPSTTVGYSPWKASVQGSTKTRDRSSTDSSLVSPGHFIPRKQVSPRVRRAQTFGTQPPITPTKTETGKPRQKSVAERRKMFEVSSDTSAPSTPIRTSTGVRSTSKLAHSKSWKSIKTSLSIPESHLESTAPPSPSGVATQVQRHPPSHDRDSTSTLLPASPTEEHSPHPLASDSPFGTWRPPILHPDERWMALKRDSFAVTAFDTSPSYIKSQYTDPEPHIAPLSLNSNGTLDSVHDRHGSDKVHSMDETRQQGWVQNARKMAYSLSSMSVGTAKAESSRSLESPRNSSDALDAFRTFQLRRSGAIRRSNLPRSRISSLRKKFDLPKSETVSFLPTLEANPRQAASGKAEKPDWPPKLSLPKSATTSDVGTKTSIASRSKSFAPRWRKRTSNRPQTPVQRRQTEHNISPLKQKIDLFESLDHQTPGSPKISPVKKRSVFDNSRTSTVGSGPFKGLRSTLRRISTSCAKSPSEWSTTSSRPASSSQHSTTDIVGGVGKGRAIADSGKEPLSPHTTESAPKQPVLGQTHIDNEISPLNLGKRVSIPFTSIPRPVFNIDGESGSSQVAAPAPLFSESQRSSFFRTKIPLIRAVADRSSLPEFGNNYEGVGNFEARHCQHTKSNGLLVSKAQCRLEQPKPVRANELRRLAGICKQKIRKLSVGGSE